MKVEREFLPQGPTSSRPLSIRSVLVMSPLTAAVIRRRILDYDSQVQWLPKLPQCLGVLQ